jgi:hypothetical protein
MLGRVERRIVAALLGIAFVARIVWLYLGPATRLQPHRSEMWHVAATFARTGALADAYAPGSGISSHVGPFNTIFEGLVYRAFGIGSPTSEMVLAVVAAVVACTLFYFLYQVAVELFIPPIARLAALAAVSLVPFDFYLEVVDFRIREGAFAAMIAAGMLWWSLRLDAEARLTTKQLWLFGLAAAFAFLINPGVALGVYAMLGFIALRYLPVRRWPGAALILLIGVLVVNGAWIVRNENDYHRFMLSRGNFGLELAVANHAGAVNPVDGQKAFDDRMNEIHPSFSPQALARLKSYPTDADYFAALEKETVAWIKAHPADFVKLSFRHLRELYFPPAWHWDLYNTGKYNVVPKQAYIWLIAFLALPDLAIGLFLKTRRYFLVCVSIAMPTLLYMIVQPTLRYRYAFDGLLTYLAAELVWRMVSPLLGRLLPLQAVNDALSSPQRTA